MKRALAHPGVILKQEECKVSAVKQTALETENLQSPQRNVKSKKNLSVHHRTPDKEVTSQNSQGSAGCNINESTKSMDLTKQSKSVPDPLSSIHSFTELTDFLSAETALRKRDRKSAWSRRMDKAAWKELSGRVRDVFNHKTPNKSIKFARKTLREAISVL